MPWSEILEHSFTCVWHWQSRRFWNRLWVFSSPSYEFLVVVGQLREDQKSVGWVQGGSG